MSAKIWDSEKALDKIRKLLALAESEENPETSKNIRKAAFELAGKYEIDMAEASQRGEVVKDRIVTLTINVEKPFMQKMQVLTTVAEYCSCTPIRIGGYKNKIHLFGMKSDMDVFRMLYASVIVQGEHEFSLTPIPSSSVPRTFRRGWWQGFSAGVWTVATAAKKKVTTESGTPGTAIVLRDKRLAVQEEIGKVYPELGKARRSRTRFTAGQREGYEAGKRVDLNGRPLSGADSSKEIAG